MLRERIREAGGWLSFAEYMQAALYAPGLGYYAAGARKFGRDGDFTTAPEISPLFGRCVANAIAPALLETQGELLELGPGSGKLAVDLLLALDALQSLPTRYLLLEVSADLRERQREAIAVLPAYLRDRCEWIDALPVDFIGAMIANEVLDVVPVHLVTSANGQLCERGVALDADGFAWRDVPMDSINARDPLHATTSIAADYFDGNFPAGYLTECAPGVAALTSSLVTALKRGVLLLIDYGFRRAEYYHPSRSTGTLMCHYRHYAHPDPFSYPGLTDITAHVDFTSVAQAGVEAGALIEGYCTQAQFLLASGIADEIGRVDASDAARYLQTTNAANRLLSPAEMGELFKVIGFSKGGISFAALSRARQLPL